MISTLTLADHPSPPTPLRQLHLLVLIDAIRKDLT